MAIIRTTDGVKIVDGVGRLTNFGRRVLYTDAEVIDASNVVGIIEDIMSDYECNRSDINYLYDYYKGKQPILYRVKDIRPEINNTIVVNHANEIVSFKVGYLCGEPIQYVGRNGDDTMTENINKLNELMFAENKSAKDKEIVEWQMICGTSYRMVVADAPNDVDEAPFEIYTLDPRNTFIVYSNDIAKKPLLAGVVNYDVKSKEIKEISCYTNDAYYLVKGGKVKEVYPNPLGTIPIIEYPANTSRQGSFEIVLALLDAINNLESNRMDGVEQFIQSFIKFVNCDIDEETFESLRRMGAIKVKSTDGAVADVQIVSSELDQNQSQTFAQDLYNNVLLICGVPSTSSGNTSDSSNNGAVILKNGWQSAEARAKDSEIMFKASEQDFLKVVLKICRDSYSPDREIAESFNVNLKLRDIECKFTRRNYEDIQSKSQVLVSMLNNDKVHPLLAFEHCGMFSDPDNAYAMSKAYNDEITASMETSLDSEIEMINAKHNDEEEKDEE